MKVMSKARSKGGAVPTTLEDLVRLPYRLEVTRGDYDDFVVGYPELPGCITQVESPDEIYPAAQEILRGWLELALEDGQEIPLPRRDDAYSGRFLMRIPRTLHRELAEAAEDEGVSLNAYVSILLASRCARRDAARQYDDLCVRINAVLGAVNRVSFQGVPHPAEPTPGSSLDDYPLAA
jgi:predicted RNase H-like HicB family nuclease